MSCLLSQLLDSRLPYAAFSASSESLQLEIDFETFFSTAEGSGIVRLEVGGRLVAAPLPSFRSRGRRDAQIGVGRPLAENRSVCQGRSYGVNQKVDTMFDGTVHNHKLID